MSVIVTFDTEGPTFRNDIFEDYKAQRDAPPESLGPQFDLAYEACQAFGRNSRPLSSDAMRSAGSASCTASRRSALFV